MKAEISSANGEMSHAFLMTGIKNDSCNMVYLFKHTG